MELATRVKTLRGFTGDASLYKLSSPIRVESAYDGDFGGDVEFVIVSATIAMFTGAETYIFPADKDGKILNYGELKGSYRGGLSHSEALRKAGYSIKEVRNEKKI